MKILSHAQQGVLRTLKHPAAMVTEEAPKEGFFPSLGRHSEGLVRVQAGALGAVTANIVASGSATMVAALAGLGPISAEGIHRLGLGVGVALAAAGVGYLGWKAGTALHGKLSTAYEQKLEKIPASLRQAAKTASDIGLGLLPLGVALSAATGLDAELTLGAGALALGATAWFCRSREQASPQGV